MPYCGQCGGEAEAFVEPDRFGVVSTNLQVDLWTTNLAEVANGVIHQAFAETLTTTVAINSEVVDPTAMAAVAGHHRADDLVLDRDDEEPRAVGVIDRIAIQATPPVRQWREGTPRQHERHVLPGECLLHGRLVVRSPRGC